MPARIVALTYIDTQGYTGNLSRAMRPMSWHSHFRLQWNAGPEVPGPAEKKPWESRPLLSIFSSRKWHVDIHQNLQGDLRGSWSQSPMLHLQSSVAVGLDDTRNCKPSMGTWMHPKSPVKFQRVLTGSQTWLARLAGKSPINEVFNGTCYYIYWLVVWPPLWKIWTSNGMISNPIYGKDWESKKMFQTTNQLLHLLLV